MERLDIMKVLTKKLRTENLDLESLSKRTEGWSGADLQLLFTNAQFFNARQIASGKKRIAL